MGTFCNGDGLLLLLLVLGIPLLPPAPARLLPRLEEAAAARAARRARQLLQRGAQRLRALLSKRSATHSVAIREEDSMGCSAHV